MFVARDTAIQGAPSSRPMDTLFAWLTASSNVFYNVDGCPGDAPRYPLNITRTWRMHVLYDGRVMIYFTLYGFVGVVTTCEEAGVTQGVLKYNTQYLEWKGGEGSLGFRVRAGMPG